MAIFQFPRTLVTGCILLTLSCKATPSTPDQTLAAATKELGQDIDIQKNATGTYYLCVQHQVSAAAPQALRFVVIEKTTLKVLLRDSFMPGFVKWSGEDTLEVLSMPGTVKKGEDISHYIRQVQIHPAN